MPVTDQKRSVVRNPQALWGPRFLKSVHEGRWGVGESQAAAAQGMPCPNTATRPDPPSRADPTAPVQWQGRQQQRRGQQRARGASPPAAPHIDMAPRPPKAWGLHREAEHASV